MNNRKGFTLIELIIVIVLISILATVTVPLIFRSGYQSKPEALKFITQVRYIQHESMIKGGGYGLGIAQKYYYFFYGTPSNLITLPGEKSSQIRVSGSINAVNSLGKAVKLIYFDNLGRPDIDNNSLNNNEMDFTNDNPYRYTITVTLDSTKILITPYSGGVYEP